MPALFVGLLGERYGWVPTGFEPSALGWFPWLAQETQKSITELEILHGVFREPRQFPALFFFRRPGLAEHLPASRQAAFVDRDPGAVEKRNALEERIWTAEGAGTRITYYDCDYAGFRIDRYLAGWSFRPRSGRRWTVRPPEGASFPTPTSASTSGAGVWWTASASSPWTGWRNSPASSRINSSALSARNWASRRPTASRTSATRSRRSGRGTSGWRRRGCARSSVATRHRRRIEAQRIKQS